MKKKYKIIVSMEGVHLLECILSLCISFALISISLPSVRDIQKKARLKKRASQVVMHFDRAHRSALANQRTIHVLLKTLNEAYQDVEISSTKEEFSFYESGATSPGTLLIRKGKLSCKITLSLRGRIRKECY